jgi:hypothetical protein
MTETIGVKDALTIQVAGIATVAAMTQDRLGRKRGWRLQQLMTTARSQSRRSRSAVCLMATASTPVAATGNSTIQDPLQSRKKNKP